MSKAKAVHQIPKQALVSLYRDALVEGTPLEKLNHKLDRMLQRSTVTEEVESQEEVKKIDAAKKQLALPIRAGAFLLPVLFISVGLFLVGNAVLPIANYYIATVPTLSRADLTTPIPREQILDVTPVVIAQASTGEGGTGAQVGDWTSSTDLTNGPTIIDTKLDYTNLANWFGSAGATELNQVAEADEYTIDIPSLEIENAKVTVGGTDLDKHLIQFPGTAHPGSAGSPVIFGHSVLRQFYNPSEKNPRRYVSIFSTIMTLNSGDEIFVSYNGVKYKYIVRDKTEVKPEDVYILTQNYDTKQLKLVTCTPEGTYLRRGVVTAQLVNTSQL